MADDAVEMLRLATYDTVTPHEIVKLHKKEQLYEREAIFGRDAASVFPSQALKAKEKHAEDLRKAVGLDSSKFISESELKQIKQSNGAAVENGAVVRDKTLAAILAENKAQKEEAFKEVWRTMKQGKNRPLDEEDLAFVNQLRDQEQAQDQSLLAAERSELESFQEAVRRAAEQRQSAGQGQGKLEAEEEEFGAGVRKGPSRLPVKLKQKGLLAKRPGEADRQQNSKRAKLTEDVSPEPGILAGLVGGYGSASDGES